MGKVAENKTGYTNVKDKTSQRNQPQPKRGDRSVAVRRAGAGARAGAPFLVLLVLLILLVFLVFLVLLPTIPGYEQSVSSQCERPKKTNSVKGKTHSLLDATFAPTAPKTAPPAVPSTPWLSFLPTNPPAALPSSVDPRPLSPSGPTGPGCPCWCGGCWCGGAPP